MDDVDSFRWRVGTTLRGKWTLERLLGVGGMAAVYVAVHKIGRREAIKILHPEVASSREIVERFEQEAHVVNRFRHPGAVEVRDHDVTEDGAPFLVMELLEGEPLGARASREPVPLDDALRYADELLDVLAAAHAHGIIHRDVKPDNLFVTREGRLKVLDFGIARMREGSPRSVRTAVGLTMGTPHYMPPEQVIGGTVDARADLYAVGATLFRLVARRHPHEVTSEIDLLVKVTTEPAPPLCSVAPHAPAPLGLVVDRALALRPDDRYPDARAMQGDVQALRRGAAPPFASAHPPAQRASARGAPTSAGVVAGAAFAAAGSIPTVGPARPVGVASAPAPPSGYEPTGVASARTPATSSPNSIASVHATYSPTGVASAPSAYEPTGVAPAQARAYEPTGVAPSHLGYGPTSVAPSHLGHGPTSVAPNHLGHGPTSVAPNHLGHGPTSVAPSRMGYGPTGLGPPPVGSAPADVAARPAPAAFASAAQAPSSLRAPATVVEGPYARRAVVPPLAPSPRKIDRRARPSAVLGALVIGGALLLGVAIWALRDDSESVAPDPPWPDPVATGDEAPPPGADPGAAGASPGARPPRTGPSPTTLPRLGPSPVSRPPSVSRERERELEKERQKELEKERERHRDREKEGRKK